MSLQIPGKGPDAEPQATVRTALSLLKDKLDADYVALALYDREQEEIRWRVAFGALSERYKAIAIRMGKGIAGDVLLTGRPLAVHDFPEDVASDPLEYPIMIIEKLISCYAAPVGDGGTVFGTLMAADRKGRIFSKSDRDTVDQAARSIGKLYAASYDPAEIRREKPAPDASPLMKYLHRHVSQPAVFSGAEILDQRITRIPAELQQEMTEWLDRLRDTLVRGGEQLRISVERKDSSRMTLEAEAPGNLGGPENELGWLIGRVGELQGNVEMYNEPGRFRVRINLPVGLMAVNAPWVF
ncbi:GAF domain-containing protein [Gorillibacterium sp. sgz5001074]|uniref:GAF domain-containing protein n=1 Tax=Gorillibacterium sp. sgz5001074 TaxID=3446695 RepID=UPI003F665929